MISTALSQALGVTSDCPYCSYRRTFHSDQGRAYQMPKYIHTLKEHHVFQSMSRKDNCYDSSTMKNYKRLLLNYLVKHNLLEKVAVRTAKLNRKNSD